MLLNSAMIDRFGFTILIVAASGSLRRGKTELGQETISLSDRFWTAEEHDGTVSAYMMDGSENDVYSG